MVCYIDQSQAQNDTILDLLFTCAGLTQPGVVGLVAGHNVRVTFCLLVEENLYSLHLTEGHLLIHQFKTISLSRH